MYLGDIFEASRGQHLGDGAVERGREEQLHNGAGPDGQLTHRTRPRYLEVAKGFFIQYFETYFFHFTRVVST